MGIVGDRCGFQRKCLLLLFKLLLSSRTFFFLSSSSVCWSRFGRMEQVALEAFSLLLMLLGCFAPGHFRSLSALSAPALSFPVESSWGVGGEGEPVQHAQPNHRRKSQQELQKLLSRPENQVLDFWKFLPFPFV